MSEVVKLWERYADGRTVCYHFRNRDGFCHGPCWSAPQGTWKRCPKTPEQAERWRQSELKRVMAERDKPDDIPNP